MAELLAVGTWCLWLFLLRASTLPESGLSSVVHFLERSSLGDLELAFGLVTQTIIEPISYSFDFLSPVLSP